MLKFLSKFCTDAETKATGNLVTWMVDLKANSH